jgi:hypothetical protein
MRFYRRATLGSLIHTLLSLPGPQPALNCRGDSHRATRGAGAPQRTRIAPSASRGQQNSACIRHVSRLGAHPPRTPPVVSRHGRTREGRISGQWHDLHSRLSRRRLRDRAARHACRGARDRGRPAVRAKLAAARSLEYTCSTTINPKVAGRSLPGPSDPIGHEPARDRYPRGVTSPKRRR